MYGLNEGVAVAVDNSKFVSFPGGVSSYFFDGISSFLLELI